MVRFAPSSTATLRAIFRTSLSVKPIARSAFKSWQMPKKSMFGFIAFLLYTKREPYSIADTVPAVSDICASGFIRRCSPSQRAISNSGGWLPLHGSCTPPRISPSCPHYVPLWLGRCTIVGWQDYRKTACQGCFRLDGYRSSPYWAVFMQK